MATPSDSTEEAVEWNKEVQREAAEDGEKTAKYAGHEVELLAKMREAVKELGLSTEAVTDKTLLRFLRARTMSVPKAAKLYCEDGKWRAEYLPVTPEEVESEIKTGKSFLMEGAGERPWLYMFAKKHDTTVRDIELFKKFAVFVLEKAIASTTGDGEETFGAVLDLGEAQYRNLDARGMLAIFDTLQAHFPERMHRLLVIHVPYIFWGVWKVVSPLIDHRTRQKIRFVEDNELSKVLSEEIPKHLLPKMYGGEAELKGYWEEHMAGAK